jgi:hypothetical protein
MEKQMKKLLFGTTALAGALALSGAASAQTVSTGGALDLRISGESQFEVEYADEDFGFGAGGPGQAFLDPATGNIVDPGEEDGDRSWFFNQDHEIRFNADGVADAMNLRYGANLELELGTGGAGTGVNAEWDEAWVYIGGSWGEVRLGDEDAVTDNLKIVGQTNNAGTGGLDGAQRTVGPVRHADSGEVTKIIYYTPLISGFQAGINYAINSGDRGSSAGNNTNTRNHIDFGANWQGGFSGVDLGVYGGLSTFTTAKTAPAGPTDESAVNYTIGGIAEYAGFSLAGSWSQNDSDVFTVDGDTSWISQVGVGTEFSGVNASFAYAYQALRNSENTKSYILSADTGLAPGLSLQGDIAWVNDFDGNDDADGINALVALEVAF